MEEHVQQPVGTSQVDDRIDRAEAEHQDRDELGRAGDGAAPFGLAHAEDRGDQRARVADADEEHEVDDVDAPVLRPVQPGAAQAETPLQDIGSDPPQYDYPEARGGD